MNLNEKNKKIPNFQNAGCKKTPNQQCFFSNKIFNVSFVRKVTLENNCPDLGGEHNKFYFIFYEKSFHVWLKSNRYVGQFGSTMYTEVLSVLISFQLDQEAFPKNNLIFNCYLDTFSTVNFSASSHILKYCHFYKLNWLQKWLLVFLFQEAAINPIFVGFNHIFVKSQICK